MGFVPFKIVKKKKKRCVVSFLSVLQKIIRPCEKPSDTLRSRRTWISFTPVDPDELVLKVLGPGQWGYRVFIGDRGKSGSKGYADRW